MKKQDELNKLRADVELIDTFVVSLLAKREKMVLKIEKMKRGMGRPITDRVLENERIAKARETARKLGMGYLFQRFIEKLFHKIIVHCRRMEERQRRKAEKKIKNRFP
jgi:DNA phosphorothioation-dependent restriction protein DptG